MIEISAGTLSQILGYVGKSMVEATCVMSRKDGLRITDMDATHTTALNVNFFPMNHDLPENVNEKIIFSVSVSDMYKVVKKFAQDVMFQMKFVPEENEVTLTAISEKKKKTCLRFKTLSKELDNNIYETIQKINAFNENCIFFGDENFTPVEFTVDKEEVENAIDLALNYNNALTLTIKNNQIFMYAGGITGEIEYYFDSVNIINNKVTEMKMFTGAAKKLATALPPAQNLQIKMCDKFPATIFAKNDYRDGNVKYTVSIAPLVDTNESESVEE